MESNCNNGCYGNANGYVEYCGGGIYVSVYSTGLIIFIKIKYLSDKLKIIFCAHFWKYVSEFNFEATHKKEAQLNGK